MDKKELLLEAFKNEFFQNDLKTNRYKIEDIINEFLLHIKHKYGNNHGVFENVESRVKSFVSFKEKIERKGYIDEWTVSENMTRNQQIICENLPDLLGYRIVCFFYEDEKLIYDELVNYFKNKYTKEFIFNFDENKIQENGHNIYKCTGIYNNKYNFEIQIKSLMHNLWGEVEHKTIYKSQNYEIDKKSKKSITDELFNILKSSDSQLNTLLNTKYDEKKLVFALFFEQTKEIVISNYSSINLGKHYSNFFDLFQGENTINAIKEYVSYGLIGKTENYIKKVLSYDENDESNKLRNLIKETFYKYEIELVYRIFEILYEVKSFEEFYIYLASTLIEKYFDYELEDCSEFDDENEYIVADKYNDIIIYLKQYFKKR